VPRPTGAQLLTISAVMAGCATIRGTRSMPIDAGVERRFVATLGAAALASRNAVVASGLSVVAFEQLGDTAWSITATAQFYEKSDLVRVVCQQVAPGVVAVRIVTRNRYPLIESNVSGDWSDVLLAQVGLELQENQRPADARN
jgi:hypothetical protein